MPDGKSRFVAVDGFECNIDGIIDNSQIPYVNSIPIVDNQNITIDNAIGHEDLNTLRYNIACEYGADIGSHNINDSASCMGVQSSLDPSVFWDTVTNPALECIADICSGKSGCPVPDTQIPDSVCGDFNGKLYTQKIEGSVKEGLKKFTEKYDLRDYGMEWYIPSIGELLMMCNRYYQIQRVMHLIVTAPYPYDKTKPAFGYAQYLQKSLVSSSRLGNDSNNAVWTILNTTLKGDNQGTGLFCRPFLKLP